MQLFSQRDSRWSSHALGWGPALGTIGEYGCFDTVLAMIASDAFADLKQTPATIDVLFTNAKIFARDPTGTYDLLPDRALDLLWPKRFATSSVAGFNAAQLAAAVKSSDTYCVLWISTPSVPTHFVLAWSADGKYIADPWTGAVGLLAGYGGPAAVHKMLLIKKLPQVAPAPAQPAPVTALPVVAPTVPPVNPTPAQPPVALPPIEPAPDPAPSPPEPVPVPTPVPSSVVDASMQGLLIALINLLLKLIGRR